jgi:hypothetical protein
VTAPGEAALIRPGAAQSHGRGWLDRIARLTRAELKPLIAQYSAGTRLQDRRRILVHWPIPWRQGCVEHMLSGALRMRGHDVQTAICGGGLPDCEHHYFDGARPRCDRCLVRSQRFCKAFGIRALLSTQYLTPSDLAESEHLTATLDEQELRNLTYDDLPVGLIAHFEMNVFHQTFLTELDSAALQQFRTFCRSAILLAKITGRLLDDVRPDIAICCNGKAFSYRPFLLQARRRGIRVVVWEEHAFDNTLQFVFNQNHYAGEIHLEDVWPTERERALTPEQTQRVERYFAKWQKGVITPFAYHEKTRRDSEFVYETLGIKRGQSVVACFPNMVRDTAAFDRDIGFRNLIDWVIQMVRYAERRPELHLVVRAHPAERCLPEKYGKYNRFFVCPEVKRHCAPLPPNVHLLEGDTPISSYALMREADVICVYTSTLGVEAALQGRQACVVGETHYREKGFTRDITRPQELWDFLDSGPPFASELGERERILAQRYAYLWRFRHPFTMPFYDPNVMEFDIPTWERLAPGGNAIIDRLCESVLSGAPFIDIDGSGASPS